MQIYTFEFEIYSAFNDGEHFAYGGFKANKHSTSNNRKADGYFGDVWHCFLE